MNMKLVFGLSVLTLPSAMAFQFDPQSGLTAYEQLKAAYEAAAPAAIGDFPDVAHADDLKCVWVASRNPDEVYVVTSKIYSMKRFHGPILGTQTKVIINVKTDSSVWHGSTNRITAEDFVITDGVYQVPHFFRKERKDGGSLVYKDKDGDHDPNFGNCWTPEKTESSEDSRS